MKYLIQVFHNYPGTAPVEVVVTVSTTLLDRLRRMFKAHDAARKDDHA